MVLTGRFCLEASCWYALAAASLVVKCHVERRGCDRPSRTFQDVSAVLWKPERPGSDSTRFQVCRLEPTWTKSDLHFPHFLTRPFTSISSSRWWQLGIQETVEAKWGVLRRLGGVKTSCHSSFPTQMSPKGRSPNYFYYKLLSLTSATGG